ncbi:MAG: hypothetical protein QHC78_16865 [Pigmentiphaga sp.]|uniref:hypothetical protein n=1 Tax=Pigmentiphaga sp. TaxID=1977564 RepID=UPI0029B624F3|nr:hypothetical protein [Pigmentiphaga sp.]MDX3907364.1 hypothetical protein [Pigmentiphaga sp.]
MPSPLPPPDDAGIPLLTEVLDIPLPSGQESRPANTPAATEAPAAASGVAATLSPAAPRDDSETQIEALRSAILQDLLERIDPLLQARMRTAVETAAARAIEEIARGLKEELARMVDEAVEKELIRRAAMESRPATER